MRLSTGVASLTPLTSGLGQFGNYGLANNLEMGGWLAATASFAVVVLNVERLAEFLGIDDALVSFVTALPSWTLGIYQAIISPTVLVLALMILSYVGGLLTEAFFRKLALRQARRFDKDKFADDCESLADALRANAPFFHLKMDYLSFIRLECWGKEDVFRKRLKATIDLAPHDAEEALAAAEFLKDVAH